MSFHAASFELADWLAALPVLLVASTITWLVSLPLRNVSIVHPLWGLLLFAAGVVYALDSDPRAPRLSPVLWLLAAWAAWRTTRLSFGHGADGEDDRHRQMRARHRRFELQSLYRVFWPQAMLAWIVSLPLHGAFASLEPRGWLDHAAVALGLTGLVLDWRPGRLPGYLGELCTWWCFGLMALAAGAWWALAGPALLTWLRARQPAAIAGRRMPTTS